MLLAVFAPKGLAVLFPVTVGATLVWNWYYKEPLRLPRFSFLLPFAAFIGYAILSSIWSPTPHVSLASAVKLGLMAIGGLILLSFAMVLEAREKTFMARAMLVGSFVALCLLGAEKITDISIWRWVVGLKTGDFDTAAPGRPMYVYNSAVSVGALFIWPLLTCWLEGRRMPAVLGVLLALLILLWSDADTPVLAIVLGVLSALFFWRARAVLRLALGVVVVILMFVAPLIPSQLPGQDTIRAEMPYMSHSALVRFMIWKVAIKHIADAPIAGLGMDTTRSLYNSTTKIRFDFLPPEPGGVIWHSTFEPIPLHPHNGILQVWLELGSIGIAGLSWIIITLIRASGNRRGDPLIMGFCVTTLAIASLSFGAWQNWWICALWLVGALLVAQLPPAERQV